MEETGIYRVQEPAQHEPNGAQPSAPVLLSREAILSRRGQRKHEIVAVPGWGGSVRVQALTGTERDAFEESLAKRRRDGTREMSLANFRAKLVARTVVDERGTPVFSPQDVDLLGELDAADLQRVFDVAQRLSGMSAQDVEELTSN